MSCNFDNDLNRDTNLIKDEICMDCCPQNNSCRNCNDCSSCKNCNDCSSCKKCSDCGVNENCCKGPCCTGIKVDKFDPSKAQAIIAYMDKIFDGRIRSGSALIEPVTTDATNYRTTVQISPCNCSCCCSTTPTLGTGTTFIVECVESELLDFRVIGLETQQASVFVNGQPVPSVVMVDADSFSINLDVTNGVPNPACDCEGVGTKSTIMLSNISGWQYRARHKISGKTNLQGQVNNFCITIEDLTAGHSIQANITSTLLVPEICIPKLSSRIIISFEGNINLLNPVLSVTDVATQQITLTANVVITPDMIVEVIGTERAWLNVIL